jgi:hypothetical protein
MRVRSAEISVPRKWRPASVVAAAIVVVLIAFPVLAADPSGSPDASASAGASTEPTATTEPTSSTEPSVAASAAPAATPKSLASAAPERPDSEESEKPDKADKDKDNKGDKTPEVAITLRGTIASTTGDKGFPTFTMSSGGKIYELEAGPPWFWGANHPLAKFVGKTVTITGEAEAGGTDVDVEAVDGTAIRAPGKPPWAGGWKVVGERHPGWSQAKADKFKAKFGDCFPPGQCKKADATTAAPSAIPRGD